MFRRPWTLALTAGALLAVAFPFSPRGLAQDVIWQLLVFGSFASIVLGVRRHRPANPRPWRLVALGIGLFAGGSLFNAAAWDHPADSPVLVAVSLTFVVAYLCVGVASAAFVRAMVPEGDREGLIDGAIVMTGAAIVLWGAVFEAGPSASAPGLAVQLENVAACLVPAWVMAMCVRVIFVAGRRQASAVLLFIGGATAFAGNVISLLLEDAGAYAPGHLVDLLWFAAFTTIAASALHPSMGGMTVPSPRRDGALPLARVTALAVSLLAAPVALRISAEIPLSSVPFIGALVLSGLVCWRFIGLVVELGRSRQNLRGVAERQAAVAQLSEAALTGQPVEALTHRALDLIWRHLPERQAAAGQSERATTILHRSGSASEALRAALPDRPFEPDEAAYIQAIANVLDVGAIREQTETAMRHRAVHDGLTGLPNRTLLEDRLANALARADRERSNVAVLFIDLDGFKSVNDTLGHAAGDRVLLEVASRISAALRPGDTLTRFAGDEFVVVIEQADLESSWAVARRIIERLEPPVVLGGSAVTSEASIGLALGGAETVAPDELIRHADAAMYRAKQRGGNRCELFDTALREELEHRHALERDLRGAARRGELALHYQPIVRLGATRPDGPPDDVVVGAEALLRWRHPVHGDVPPAEFISLAESSGLIGELGDWVLAEAIGQLATWQGRAGRELTLYVNLSPVQLADPRLFQRIRDLLDQTGADPTRLGVEITESAVLDEGDATIAMVLALRRLGIRVALDDFGTGYSSLTHLRSVPLDLLKVDASFVNRIDERGDRAIVAAVAAMARALEVTVLAEGIELPEQLEAVRALGCDLAQGFLLGRPASAAELTTLLRLGQPAGASASEGRTSS